MDSILSALLCVVLLVLYAVLSTNHDIQSMTLPTCSFCSAVSDQTTSRSSKEYLLALVGPGEKKKNPPNPPDPETDPEGIVRKIINNIWVQLIAFLATIIGVIPAIANSLKRGRRK